MTRRSSGTDGRSRAIWRNKARRLLEEGGEFSDEALSAVNRALSVSNDMIMRFIGVLRRMGLAFYVAPYEADAQLAFLSKAKLIDIVISEDSDCIPYGCKTVTMPSHWAFIGPLQRLIVCTLVLPGNVDPLQAQSGRLGQRAQTQKSGGK